MKTISIINKKGGVGKTTAAVNIAYELSIRGFNVLTIDLDDQCDFTKVMLEEVMKVGIKDVLEKKTNISNVSEEIYDRLFVVSGSRDLNHFKVKDDKPILKKCLKHKNLKHIDYVIIDHPPNLNEASLQGLIASDIILIISDVEAFGIENLNPLLDDLIAICFEMNKDIQIAGVVANKVDMRRSLTKRKLKELEETLGDSFFKTYISNDTAIPTAHDLKIPVRNLHWRVVQSNNFLI